MFATYGNHGSVRYAYGDLCLMVEVCRVERRVGRIEKLISQSVGVAVSVSLSKVCCFIHPI